MPLSGLPGSTVTIYGSGFSTDPLENIVFVGGAHAYVKTASANKLTVQVPRSTTNKPISVTVNNLTGFSALPYITTYKTGNVVTPGTFETPKNFRMSLRANVEDGLTIEDLDNDGKPDIFAKSRIGLGFLYSIYRNTSTPGNISFAPEISAVIPLRRVDNILPLADIDGDGKKDLLCRNSSEEFIDIRILRNKSTRGNISFENPQSVPLNTRDHVFDLGVADLNGDGKLDLFGIKTRFYATDDPSPDSIAFTQNTSSAGNISFAPPVLLHFNFLNYPYALADFNGDGKIDVLSVTHDASSNYSISVSINTSSHGNISFDDPKNIFPAGSNLLLGVGDVNKDGKPDIAISSLHTKNDSLLFLLNTSTSNNVSFAAPVSFPYGLNAANFHLVDVDGDGKLDISAYKGNTGNYVILKNTSSTERLSFASPVSFPAFPKKAIEFGDFDGDGRQDLSYTVRDYFSFVSIHRNQTDTALGIPSIVSFTPATANQNDTLTIDGDNFNGTTNITLGGTPVQSFKVISNNKISAVVNRGSTGDLQVTTRKGVATKSLFTYLSDTTVKLLSTSSGIVCSENLVKVKAVVTNADKGIFYRWYKNGKLSTISGNIYSSRALVDGDSLWCVVFFSRAAGHKEWKSDVIKFDVNLSRNPKLRIQPSRTTTICKGTPITFKAIINKIDFVHLCQWKKNDQVVGDSSDTYVDDNLKNGDLISCMIVQAPECIVIPGIDSLRVAVDESKPSAPALIIGPDEVSPSQAGVIFSVSPVADVRKYKWQIPHDAWVVSGNGTDSVIVNWGTTTAKISVVPWNACGAPPAVTKTVRVTSTNERIAKMATSKQVTNETGSIMVYPNPANNKVSIVLAPNSGDYYMIELRDPNGKLLLHQKITTKAELRTEINTSTFAPGVYYIQLIDKSNKITSKRLIIAK